MQIKDPEAEKRREKINVPVYSIFGTGDKYLSVAADKGGSAFVENFQSVYLEGVSHWSPEERPAEVIEHIDNYLRKHF